MNIKVRKHLYDFKRLSYVDEGEENSSNKKEIVDCSLGINPFGCSKLISEKKDLLDIININNYPQYPYTKVREDICKYWSDVAEISIDNIRLGNGSIGILNAINMIFVDRDSTVLGYCPQFSDYIADVQCQGGVYEYIQLNNEKNFKFDANDIINRISNKHRLIYIDNPNNPTGQIISISELRDIIEEANKKDITVIIDEAYGEFMSKENSAVTLVNKYSNLFVVRTFSKGFGLAGIRVGYTICSKTLIEYFKKVEIPFSVDTISYNIARIALKDIDFIKDSIERIKEIKSKLIKECSKIKVLETGLETPIMLMMHPNNEFDLYEAFKKNNVLTESGEGFIGLGKNFVRLRIPKKIDNLIDVIKKIESEEFKIVYNKEICSKGA